MIRSSKDKLTVEKFSNGEMKPVTSEVNLKVLSSNKSFISLKNFSFTISGHFVHISRLVLPCSSSSNSFILLKKSSNSSRNNVFVVLSTLNKHFTWYTVL